MPAPDNNPSSTRSVGLVFGLLAWFSLAGLMILVFQDQLADLMNPNRSVQSVHTAEAIEVTLQQSRGGHYLADGTINEQDVTFLLDTGATQVAIPQRVADELGLVRGREIQVNTASGVATAYVTELDSLGLGDIRLRDVDAHILPDYDSEAILLGMSALDRLDWARSGSELTLRYRVEQ